MNSEINSGILSVLMNDRNKGQIRTVTFRRPIKLKKEFKGMVAEKETTTQIRCGVKYDNLAKVIEAKKPKQKLVGKEWIHYPYVLKSNAGNILFRFYKVENNNTKIKYYLDGQEISPLDIEYYALSSELSDNPNMVFDARIDTIKEIK